MGLHVFATSISQAVSTHTKAGLSNNSLAYILTHFERTAYSTISSPVGQQILHDKIPSILMSQPFLLHTVLAFSSSHLEYLSRGKSDRGNLLLTASYHTERALSMYSDRIRLHQRDLHHDLMRTTSSITEMDGLFAACILLTSLFYHVNEFDFPHKSWTVSSDPRDEIIGKCEPVIDWITNASGLSILLQLTQFQKRLAESIWRPFMMEATHMNGFRDLSAAIEPDVYKGLVSGSRPSCDSLPPLNTTADARSQIPPLHQIHDFRARHITLPEASTTTLPHIPPHLLRLAITSPRFAVYKPALMILNLVLGLNPCDTANFAAFISFPSRLSPEFVGLLHQKNYYPAQPCSDHDPFRCESSSSFILSRTTPSLYDVAVPGLTEPLPLAMPNPDPIALLILGYWFDSIGRIPYWWCGRRGKGERVAILQWLEGKSNGGEVGILLGAEGEKMFARALGEFKEKVQAHTL